MAHPAIRRTVGRATIHAIIAVAAAALPLTAQDVRQSGDAQLAAAKAALEKYQDPIVAVHDGFFSTLACIEYPKGGGDGPITMKPGAMGVHFLNLSHIGPTLTPDKPQVLIYEPVGDKLRLVAAEWFVPVQAAGDTRPSIFGQQLEGPMHGHKPIMPEALHHYDLHVWLWKDNPAGMFHPTNASVKCPRSGYTFSEDAPKMVHTHKP